MSIEIDRLSWLDPGGQKSGMGMDMNRNLFSCVILSVALLGAQSALTQVLWDNGPLVTHPGAGPGGLDVSMSSVEPNSAGSNTTAVIWRADDFEVTGAGWMLSSIDTFAYDTNFSTPRWTSALIEIRQGSPDGVAVGSVAPTWAPSGINRIFNGAGNLDNEARQVNTISADFDGLVLSPGTYWVTLSITHSAGFNSWVPFVMDPNPEDPDDPITRIGNSLVSLDSGVNWEPWSVTVDGWNNSPELPFLINGQVLSDDLFHDRFEL